MRFLLPGEPPPLGQIGAMPFVGPPPRQVQGGAIAAPAIGTPTIVGVTTNTAPSGTSVAIAVDPAVQNGDLLVVNFHRFGGGTVYNTPAGWNRLDANETSFKAIFWRIASNEPASYNFTHTVGGASSIAMIAIRDCNQSSPIQTYNYATAAASLTVSNPSIATANDRTFLLQCATTAGTRTGSASTMPELWDLSGTTNIGAGETQATAGASGAKTITLSGSATWYSHLIAIKPSGST